MTAVTVTGAAPAAEAPPPADGLDVSDPAEGS